MFPLHVSVSVQLSVGAALSLDSQKPLVPRRNFQGCLENLLYNNLNLIERAKHNDQQVTLMVSSSSREHTVTVMDKNKYNQAY